MPTPPARPPFLLSTCILLGVGSSLVLTELVDALASWGTVEMQDLVRDTLKEEPLASADISVAQAMSGLRVLAYVGVVLTAAGAVFSVFTARGDRTSRIMLTILCALAGLVFVAAGLPGLIPAIIAMFCATSLWTPDVRRWFDAVNGKEVATVGAATASAAASASTIVDATDRPVGERPQAGAAGLAPAAVDVQPPSPPAPAPATGSRPRAVVRAIVSSAVAHSVLALMGLVLLGGISAGGEAYRAEIEKEGILKELMAASDVSVDAVLTMLGVIAWGCVAAAVLGLIATAYAARPRRGAKIALQLTLALTGLASLTVIPFGLVGLVGVVVGFVQLEKPEAKAWFAA